MNYEYIKNAVYFNYSINTYTHTHIYYIRIVWSQYPHLCMDYDHIVLSIYLKFKNINQHMKTVWISHVFIVFYKILLTIADSNCVFKTKKYFNVC